MSRSSKKGPYCDPKLLKRVQEQNASGKKEVIKTWSRRSTIFPEFIEHISKPIVIRLTILDRL